MAFNISTYNDISPSTYSANVSGGAMFPIYKVSNDPKLLSAMQTSTIHPRDRFVTYCESFRKNFKKGDIVQGVKVNTEDTVVNGKLDSYKIDTGNKRIRVFVLDELDNEVKEVYPEALYSMTALAESLTHRI